MLEIQPRRLKSNWLSPMMLKIIDNRFVFHWLSWISLKIYNNQLVQNRGYLMNSSTLVISTDKFDFLVYVWYHSAEAATKFPRDQWCFIRWSEIIMHSSLFCRWNRLFSLSSRRLISPTWMNMCLSCSDHLHYSRSCSMPPSEKIFKPRTAKVIIDAQHEGFVHISLF